MSSKDVRILILSVALSTFVGWLIQKMLDRSADRLAGKP